MDNPETDTKSAAGRTVGTINASKKTIAQLRLMSIVERLTIGELVAKMVAERRAGYPEHVRLTLEQMEVA